MYLRGEGVPRDLNRAADLFKKAVRRALAVDAKTSPP